MSDQPNSIGLLKPKASILAKPVYVEVKEEEKDFSNNPKLLYSEIVKLQKEYQLLLKKKAPVDKQVTALRSKIRSYVEILLFMDWNLCIQKDLLFQFWKGVDHYTFQEFRKLLKKAESSIEDESDKVAETERLKKVNESIRLFLTNALEQYQKLLKKLQEIVMAKPELHTQQELQKKISQFYYNKLYLIMGDLERYIQTHKPKDAPKDLSQAKQYYLTALHSDPFSAICHNQLAVVTSYVSTEDSLEMALASKEMLYRYYRALSVPKPFTTAKDNLILLLERNRLQFVKLHQEVVEKHSHSRGGRGGKSILSTARNSCKQMDTFLVYFIRLHGILYTKTSYETFDDIKSYTMKGLRHLLSQHDMPLSESLLLEFTLINLFEIENCSTVEVLYAASISLACSMMKEVMDCSLNIHPHSYLQSIYLFIKYIRLKSLKIEDEEMWYSMAQLLNTLHEISTLSNEQGVIVVLPEDVECLGFAPLLDSSVSPQLELYSPWNDDIIEQKEKQLGDQQVMNIRMDRIKQEANQLLAFTQPKYLWFDMEEKVYKSGQREVIVQVEKKDNKFNSQQQQNKKSKKSSSSSQSSCSSVKKTSSVTSTQSTPDDILETKKKKKENIATTKSTPAALPQYLFNENDHQQEEEENGMEQVDEEEEEEADQPKVAQEFFLFQPTSMPLLKPSDVTRNTPPTTLLEKPFGNTTIHDDQFFSKVSVLKHDKNTTVVPVPKKTESVLQLLNPSALKASSSSTAQHKEEYSFFQNTKTSSTGNSGTVAPSIGQQTPPKSTVANYEMPFTKQQQQMPQQPIHEMIHPFGAFPWNNLPFMMPPAASMPNATSSTLPQPFMPNYPVNAPTKHQQQQPLPQPPYFAANNLGFIPPNILHQLFQQPRQ